VTRLLLIGLLAGLLITGGLVALVAGVVGTRAARTPGPVSSWRAAWSSDTISARERARFQLQIAVAVVGALTAWLFTGWAVVGLIVAALVMGVPWLVSPNRKVANRIEQLDALAEWTRRLSDVLLLGMGLEQALITSRKTAPAALDREIGDLAARLRTGWRPEDALRAFADELSDATADKVAAALILRAADRGPGLASALTDLADAVREEVRQRRLIEADRAKPRTTVRWLTYITTGLIVAGSFDTSYIQPYGSFLGQIVLTVLLASFAGVLIWMRSMASYRPTPRFLARDRRDPVAEAVARQDAVGQARILERT
jgi:Flp pilus assembly protein TadB